MSLGLRLLSCSGVVVLAPWSASSRTICRLPASAAMNMGVLPTQVARSRSIGCRTAPASPLPLPPSRRLQKWRCTASRWPACTTDALLSIVSTKSTARTCISYYQDACTSSTTKSTDRHQRLTDRQAHPALLLLLLLLLLLRIDAQSSFCIASSRTTPLCGALHAAESGVLPNPSAALGSAPSPSSTATVLLCPRRAAAAAMCPADQQHKPRNGTRARQSAL
jgi:hypothetical protein